MKNSLILALFLFVAANAEEVENHVEPRYKLLEEVANKMIDLVSGAIKEEKKVFGKLIKAAETCEHKDETEFKLQLNQFVGLFDSMKTIETEKKEDSLHLTLKLFTIYENISTLTDKYDITNSRLSPNERIFAEMLKEAGQYKADLIFYQNMQQTSKLVKSLVQNFYDDLSETDKLKEHKMLAWLKQTETPQSHFGANLNTLFEFFDVYA